MHALTGGTGRTRLARVARSTLTDRRASRMRSCAWRQVEQRRLHGRDHPAIAVGFGSREDIADIPRKLFYDSQYPLAPSTCTPRRCSRRTRSASIRICRSRTTQRRTRSTSARLCADADLQPRSRIAPDFSVNPDPMVMKIANRSKRLVAHQHARSGGGGFDPAVASQRGAWNIVTGGYMQASHLRHGNCGEVEELVHKPAAREPVRRFRRSPIVRRSRCTRRPACAVCGPQRQSDSRHTARVVHVLRATGDAVRGVQQRHDQQSRHARP